MKINYIILNSLNRNSLTERGDQLSCYWLVQQGLERLCNGQEIEDIHKNLLLELGVLELTEKEETPFVKPHNFTENG